MFTTTRKLALVVVALSGFGFAGQTATAASFDHIDSLAQQLERNARSLELEFRTHFRHASHYRHLINDAAEMRRLAAHVHDVAHSGNFSHLERDVADLDRVFHHVEGLVAEIEFDAGEHHFDDFGHGGHIHGNTRRVRGLLGSMEDTLHHLQSDLQDLRPRQFVPAPRPAVRVTPAQGGGLMIGNGRIQFRVGF